MGTLIDSENEKCQLFQPGWNFCEGQGTRNSCFDEHCFRYSSEIGNQGIVHFRIHIPVAGMEFKCSFCSSKQIRLSDDL